jgi:hypothetical protein
MLSYPGLASLGAQKHYVSLYMMPAVLAEQRDAFPGLSAGRSCLRFRKLERLDPAPLRKLLADVLAARRRGASSSWPGRQWVTTSGRGWGAGGPA